MKKNIMRKPEEKEKIVLEIMNGGGGFYTISKKYNISTSVLSRWYYAYEKHGIDGLKSKNRYQLSPNTDLKLFGDLFPGPGQYYNPKMKIGQNQNFRYNNLYTKENEPNLTLKYKIIKDFYYNSKVGPGTYDPNDNIVYKSYAQNPKVFISQLERGPLFKINFIALIVIGSLTILNIN